MLEHVLLQVTVSKSRKIIFMMTPLARNKGNKPHSSYYRSRQPLEAFHVNGRFSGSEAATLLRQQMLEKTCHPDSERTDFPIG